MTILFSSSRHRFIHNIRHQNKKKYYTTKNSFLEFFRTYIRQSLLRNNSWSLFSSFPTTVRSFTTDSATNPLSRLSLPPIPTVQSVTRSPDGKYMDIQYSIAPPSLSFTATASSTSPTFSRRYPALWLRDHCLCSACTHPVTLQRCMNTQTLSTDKTLIDSVTYHPSSSPSSSCSSSSSPFIRVQWSSSTVSSSSHPTSIYPISWLIQQAYYLPVPTPSTPDTWQNHVLQSYSSPVSSPSDHPSSSPSPPPPLYPAVPFDIANDTRYRRLWDSTTFSSPHDYPRVTQDKFLKDDRTLVESLLAIRDDGFVLVEGVIPTIRETEKLCRRLSPQLRSTLYGKGMWTTHISPNQSSINDTAFTAAPLDPHTDGNYFQDSPGIQVFHAIEADPNGGGDSLLVDGYRIAQEMVQKHPKAFYILSQLYIPYHHTDPDYSMRQTKRVFNFRSPYLYNQYRYVDPFITASHPNPSSFFNELSKVDIQHMIETIHFNNDDRAPLQDIPLSLYEIFGTETINHIYESIQLFQNYIKDPRYVLRFGLRPGTVLFFNNNRVLHGRTGFASNSQRTLAGCYINEEDWKSRLRIMGKKIATKDTKIPRVKVARKKRKTEENVPKNS